MDFLVTDSGGHVSYAWRGGCPALAEGDTPQGPETNAAEALLDADLNLFKDTMDVPFEPGTFEYAFETYIENTPREELDGFLAPFSREFLEANKKFLESDEFLLMKPELQENSIRSHMAMKNDLAQIADQSVEAFYKNSIPYQLAPPVMVICLLWM